MFIKSALCAVAICLASGAALAQPAPLPAGPVAGLGPIMPPQEISKILRANGLAPQATPVRNGEAYQVRAIDRYGRQVRVAIDARYGDLLMVRPIAMVRPGAYGPRTPPGYYDDMPTGAVGAYPPGPGMGRPPGQAAALAPAKPPIPRPKPAAKPAAAAPAQETPPAAAASSASSASTPAPPSAPAPAAANPPPATPAMPPVTPLE